MLRLFVLLAMISATPLCAATLTVTNLNDIGAGSLRDTVAAAVAGDEIVFDAALAGGSITFASAISPAVALTITGPVDGSGKPNLTLDGNDTSPFFFSTVNLSLNNLRLFDGRAADSAVQTVSCHLVATNCVFESNVSGIGGSPVDVNTGSVWLADCEFIDNPNPGGDSRTGGLSAADSEVTVRRCTFKGGSGEISGAIAFIANFGGHRTMLVEESTFSQNSATESFSPGGAISVIGATGGSVSRALHVTLVRCTYSENTSTSGAGGQCIALWSFNSINTLQVAARDCIFYDSVAGTMLSANLGGATGGYVSFGHNLCSDAPGWMNSAGDQVNTDPLLQPLADNGGLTRTHAIDATSPAFHAGNVTVPGNDQRGRLRDSTPDIGAFELQAADLRVAEGANAITSGSTLLSTSVVLPGAAQPRTFTLTNAATAEQDLAVTVPVTISGAVNCTATATTQPGATLTPGTSSDLIVEATPTATGFFQYTVTITSNDPDTPSFTFTVASYAQTPGNGGGGGDDNDSGCSTGASSSQAWLALLALIAVLGTRVRRRV